MHDPSGPHPPVQGPWPPPGHPAATVLRPPTGPSGYLWFLGVWSPVLGLLFVVLLLLGSILFENLAAGTGTLAGVAVGAVGVGCAAAALLVKKHRAQTGTWVVVSPTGVELRDTMGFEVRMRWADVVSVGTVYDQQGRMRRIGAGHRGGGVRTPVGRSEGLRGWGERTVPPHAPGWMRAAMAAQPRDPHTGRQSVAVSFSAAGEPGPDNPLRAHARHHRPDLFR